MRSLQFGLGPLLSFRALGPSSSVDSSPQTLLLRRFEPVAGPPAGRNTNIKSSLHFIGWVEKWSKYNHSWTRYRPFCFPSDNFPLGSIESKGRGTFSDLFPAVAKCRKKIGKKWTKVGKKHYICEHQWSFSPWLQQSNLLAAKLAPSAWQMQFSPPFCLINFSLTPPFWRFYDAQHFPAFAPFATSVIES